jgi:hypothetical protein
MKKKRAELLWPFECRTCHDRQLIVANDLDPDNFQLTQRCQRCGFINVLESYAVQLPLSEAWAHLPTDVRESLPATPEPPDEPQERVALLKRSISAFLQGASRLVTADVNAARAALVLGMRERERLLQDILADSGSGLSHSFDERPQIISRVTDLLYLLLQRASCATLPAAGVQVEEVGGPFMRAFFGFASEAAFLATMLHSIGNGTMALVVREGKLFIEKTDVNSRIAEWDLNRHHLGRHFSGPSSRMSEIAEALSHDTTEAQRLVLGFDVVELRELFEDRFTLLRRLGAVDEGADGIIIINSSSLETRQRLLLDAVTLTFDRAQRFVAPFYFDLGTERRTAANDSDVLAQSLRANWTNYYPLYQLTDNTGVRVVATTASPAIFFFGHFVSFKALLLQRLAACARHDARDKKIMARVNKLTNRVHQQLEAYVREDGLALQWFVSSRLKRFQGRDLECGEIDVVLAKQTHGQTIVVLAEAKDIDLTLLKGGALPNLERKLQEAFDQLERKREWLRQHWNAGLREVVAQPLPDGHAQLVPIVVTAWYMPPFLFDRFPGVPIAGFRFWLQQLEEGGLELNRLVAGETIGPVFNADGEPTR